MSTWETNFIGALLETVSLSSATNTRQTIKCIRQVLCRVTHSTKITQWTWCLQRPLCRVPSITFYWALDNEFAKCRTILDKVKSSWQHRVTEALPSAWAWAVERTIKFNIRFLIINLYDADQFTIQVLDPLWLRLILIICCCHASMIFSSIDSKKTIQFWIGLPQ